MEKGKVEDSGSEDDFPQEEEESICGIQLGTTRVLQRGKEKWVGISM